MANTIEDFIGTATEEQKDVLRNIKRLGDQEHKLATEINNIYNSIDKGVYSPDGCSIAVCEDEDDARVISMGPRYKLSKVRDEIKDYMVKAVELDMDELGFIQRNYEHYVGEKIPEK